MRSLWTALFGILLFGSLAAGEQAWLTTREKLRIQISDRYLLAACELLISETESDPGHRATLPIRLAAASQGICSNIARCERSYGSGWKAQWQEMRPYLQAAYEDALMVLMEEDRAVEKLHADMERLGISPQLTALSTDR